MRCVSSIEREIERDGVKESQRERERKYVEHRKKKKNRFREHSICTCVEESK